MRDIVATIQPEQDVIVRSELEESVCVQGAPGTGKTAVGLHRAAYLLYAHRDQLSRQGVLVVGPNASFLRYIGDVLPALGEIDAQQTTIEGLVGKTMARLSARYVVRGEDPPRVAVLKGDARLALVLERAMWSQVGAPAEGWSCRAGARRWRLAPYEVDEILDELRARGVRYGAARGMLAQRIAHRLLVKMENSRGLTRRPGAGRGGAQPRGEEVRRPGLAVRGPRPAGAAPAQRPRRWPPRPTACSATRSRPCCSGQAAEGPRLRAAGRSPTRCSSTRRPTWWSAPRHWATSSRTRRRTSRR